MTSDLTLTARWVFPVDSVPLPHGSITISENTIVTVSAFSERTADIDLGNVALLPGFVNAHTHLDLSGCRGQIAPSADFTGWLRKVIASRRVSSIEQTDTDIAAGLAAALRFGTTTLGDISATGASWDALVEAPCWSVVYREVLGLTTSRAQQALADAIVWLVTHPMTMHCHPGLSPHAPYSVRYSLYQKIADLGRETGLPIVSHIGETLDEITLLSEQRGAFVPFLQDAGVWDAGGLAPSHAELLDLFEGNDRFGIAHGNYLESCLPMETVRQMTRIYCPRTHRAFGHAPYPLSVTGRFALGTDSLASNPDLDIFAEAHWLAQDCPDLSCAKIVEMLTRDGANLLGFGDVTGTLTPGKSADIVALPLPDIDMPDPYRLLFHPNLNLRLPRRTWWRGIERIIPD